MKSGSTVSATALIGPGDTTQVSSSGWATWTPRARSHSTVMSIWRWLGTSPSPSWRSVSPRGNRAAASSSPDTNWLDPVASTVAEPPRMGPVIENGSSSPSTVAPSWRRPSRMGWMGRALACSSPVKRVVPFARAATGGTNRMTVPASPQSIWAAARTGLAGRTFQVRWSESSMTAPSALSASRISCESRASSGPVMVPGPLAIDASSRARAVADLEPGTTTRARSGPAATGAGPAAGGPMP